MTEAQWTRKVCTEMRRCNALIFAIVGSRMQEPGWPDRYICHTWWHGWLEFKGEHTRLTPHQTRIINFLNSRQPGCAYVVRWPGILLDAQGTGLARFTNGKELLERLRDAHY